MPDNSRPDAITGFAPDARLVKWLDRTHSLADSSATALYFLNEPTSRKLDLIPYIPHTDERPPFPSTVSYFDQNSSFWDADELPNEFFSFPFLEGRTWNAIPLRIAGLTMGILIVVEPKNLSNLHEMLAEGQIALARLWIEYLVSFQARTLTGILRVTNDAASTLSLRQVLVRLVREAAVLFNAKLCSLMMVDDKKQELILQAAYGCSLEYIDRPNLSIQETLFGTVILDGKPLLVDDVREHPRYRDREMAKMEGLCSLLAVPIRFRGEDLGVLALYSATPRQWTPREVSLVESLASSAAVAIRNARFAEEIRETESQFLHASRLATLGELSATLAHQIRNPLAVINVLIHSWEHDTPSPDEAKEDLKVIATKINELNAIIEGAVQLARRRPLERKAIYLRNVIEGVLIFLDHRIQDKGVQIKFEKPEKRWEVQADAGRLQHAFLNLLSNALDAVGEDGRIEIVLHFDRENAFVDIRDNGPGIDQQILDNLGQAFHTTKPDGLGLGISITKRIIDDHGGEFGAANLPEKGAMFRLRLPIR